ncbi:MAG: 16S rRNA (cytidine(1402)-2'-O)-methyltransferase [Desulfofustis sp.]|nr:16S rRNA (cytidine(1402)-2'-O)-methyltransferase [Desulfofustis sp.]NNK57068.1 16S rRNA (cytidine(1402)-2'-O)-methyltransferase [Desulfofustis sp.]
MPGNLYIVATPIGNLEDMTHRATRILKEVDLIAAEDTRHTRKLLTHFNIHTHMVSYYREKEASRTDELIDRLLEGENIALVSDAGTPGISDPGAILVNKARWAGISIIPIPGPSALTAALSCAGLEPGSFLFSGFGPAKTSSRKKLFESLSTFSYPLVFYESPHRIGSFIKDAHAVFGDRTVLWAREISKKYEEIEETTLELLESKISSEKIRGELVIIIHPGSDDRPVAESLEEILVWYRENSALSLKDVCRKVAADMGIGRSEVYKQALTIWNKKQ